MPLPPVDWQPSDLVIVAARSAMDKIANDIAEAEFVAKKFVA